mgnify:CR=1 FL=1
MTNKDTYFDEPDFKSHMYFIIKESSLIVETDPFESLKLFNTAYKMYDEVGHFPHEIIELSVNIVFNIAKKADIIAIPKPLNIHSLLLIIHSTMSIFSFVFLFTSFSLQPSYLSDILKYNIHSVCVIDYCINNI